ncbi:MAG TPA: M57 family metalloprotease [Polyangiaceae bacterium]|nr:M57 family metalloprotease [Polyangiaceae bacterium]
MIETVRARLLAAVVGGVVLGGAAVACGVPGDVDVDAGAEKVGTTTVTFEEFEARTYREPDTGVYIVDGDTPMATREALYHFWATYVQPGALAIANLGTDYASDLSWGLAQQENISYCVSTAFGSKYTQVVQAMAAAAADWQAAARVRFVYRADQDGACTPSNNNVVFDVNPTSGQPYQARAFFPPFAPGDVRANQNVLIDAQAFGDLSPLTFTGLLRHELGHVLGFRHEHIRPEAGSCTSEGTAGWRALTPYDSASVMHYWFCNGTHQGDYVLTALDRAGVVAKYGPKGSLCRPTKLSWSAQSLPHAVGRADADGWSANMSQDPVGHLQYGPYTADVTAGPHAAVWNLMIDNNTANDQAIVRLDVVDASTGGTVLASRELRRKEWRKAFEYQAFTVPFALDASRAGHAIEFRVLWYKAAYVRLHSVYADPACLSAPQSWGAQGLPHLIGRADADGWSANMSQDPSGYLQYGPYTAAVTAGPHTAIWNLMIDNNTSNNQAVMLLDVVDASTGGTVLASRQLARTEWTAPFQYQSFAVPFALDGSRVGHAIEFRAFWYNVAYVREQSVSVD